MTSSKKDQDLDTRTIERVRAEFVAKVMQATGFEDAYSVDGCPSCGPETKKEGHAFTLEDIHKILNDLRDSNGA